MKRLIYFIIIPIIASCNGSKISSGMVDEQAPVIVYKTVAKYFYNVPVTLNEAKDKVISYPAPSDLYYKGELATPIKLKKGYLLDRRGINATTVFTSYTYEEYSKLEAAPTVHELFSSIIEMSPFESLYECGKASNYENLEKELNIKISKVLMDCTPLLDIE